MVKLWPLRSSSKDSDQAQNGGTKPRSPMNISPDLGLSNLMGPGSSRSIKPTAGLYPTQSTVVGLETPEAQWKEMERSPIAAARQPQAIPETLPADNDVTFRQLPTRRPQTSIGSRGSGMTNGSAAAASPPSSGSSTNSPLFGKKTASSLEAEVNDVNRQKQQAAFESASSMSRRSLMDEDDDDVGAHQPSSGGSGRNLQAGGGGSRRRMNSASSSSSLNSPPSNRNRKPPPPAAPVSSPVVGLKQAPVTAVDESGRLSPRRKSSTLTDSSQSSLSCGGSNNSEKASLSRAELEDAQNYARYLQQLCKQDNVDLDSIETIMGLCLDYQQQVTRILEAWTDPSNVELLCSTVGILHEAIEEGKQTKDSFRKKPASSGGTTGHGGVAKATTNLAVPDLVERRDIFSLICLLRAQLHERRLEAAWALMCFARDAEQKGDNESVRLRHEISSSGGMHSLLTLFRAQGATNELRIVVAMAVAYLLPSFVVSTSQTQNLKIMECLRELSKSDRSITPNGQLVTEQECYRASVMGLYTFWLNQLGPLLQSGKAKEKRADGENDTIALGRNTSLGGRTRTRAGGALFDQRREAFEVQELLEMTVSLIVFIGQRSMHREDEAVASLRYTLIEQICVVEAARPIAVREGILSILVEWIKSNDRQKVRPAASALRHLTSIKDKYMAGWIHSQMISENAVQGIIQMSQTQDDVDSRLAVAQILSSLCVAPHTRAAVVEANGIFVLSGLLVDHADRSAEERVLAAASALVQLAAGAITRASVFADDDRDVSGSRGSVVHDIIDSGALPNLVQIALEKRGKLRVVAVEALRVLSEDVSPKRHNTRGELCENSAAEALGVSLMDNVRANKDMLLRGEKLPGPQAKELHEGLCALANILDPLPEGSPTSGNIRVSTTGGNIRKLLIDGCIETAKSGGLESLLFIASLPVAPHNSPPDIQRMSLLEESCRSLASMSPLLLKQDVAKDGYSRWADDVFKTLCRVLKQIEGMGRLDQIGSSVGESAAEVQVNSLRGLGALARSEPMKIRIIDKVLPYLLQTKSEDGTDVANAASQAFQCLGFTDDEVAVQVAGSNPQLLADWFCLERSGIIQAMARTEIKQTVLDTWGVPFQDSNDLGFTKLIREVSDFSRSDDGSAGGGDLFENFVNDAGSYKTREAMISQYKDIYGKGDAPTSPLLRGLQDGASKTSVDPGLLFKQMYPLSSTTNEAKWVLSHSKRASERKHGKNDSIPVPSISSHVDQLLRCCFPSEILRYEVLPIYSLRPGASFNFRALMMPQQRYFSFRREGQLLSRLCADEAARLDTTDIHWTLGFTNSSFAGEFSEALVQALYLCPMILGLSFSNNSPRKPPPTAEVDDDDTGPILANLTGSLPPWISSLTFDGVLSDTDMRSLVTILKTMGKLITADLRMIPQQSKASRRGSDFSTATMQGQGKFGCFAVRRCVAVVNPIQSATWMAFFGLLGKTGPGVHHPTQTPLSSLKVLDVSDNGLGDELCSVVLGLVLDKDSGCCLEKLDLSGNGMGEATRAIKVIRDYASENRRTSTNGRGSAGWRSTLQTLRIANNNLQQGNMWLTIFKLLQNDYLDFQDLDLSSNGFVVGPEAANIAVASLEKNTCLVRLNLSKNRIVSDALELVLARLSGGAKDSMLAFLQLEENSPPLSPQQRAMLTSFSARARRSLLHRNTIDRENQKFEDTSDSELLAGIEEMSGNLQRPENAIREDMETLMPAMGAPLRQPSMMRTESTTASGDTADNMITVLFSAPLVYADGNKVLRPFAKLDFGLERELMWQCLKEASRDIKLSFDNATDDRFLAAVTQRCSCLHYSGHGHEEFLPFEDKGGAHWLKVTDIQDLIKSKGGASFKFVFVSACHSELAGKKFASAGVPHVVCCRQENELKDQAALAFTRQFYLSLAVGHTVKESFDQGCKAVKATPNLRKPEQEMRKFVLLPEDGNHDIPIFNAKPVLEWPQTVDKLSNTRGHKAFRSTRKLSLYSGGTRTSELSVRNMMQEDPSPSPPQFFLGREVDMFHVLQQILEKRLVSVIGETGIGRSSLVCAVCHYINERATTMTNYIQQIYYVRARKGVSNRRDRPHALLRRLFQKLVSAGKCDDNKADEYEDDVEGLCDAVCTTLKSDKALVVFDRVDLLEDEENELPMILSQLQRETRHVKVLMTNRRSLGIPSIGEKTLELGPLHFSNTVKLFAQLCSYVHTPKERKDLSKALAKDKSQSELLPTDPCLSSQTTNVFSILGDGHPSKIEKAAYNISKETFLRLMSGSVHEKLCVPLSVQEM